MYNNRNKLTDEYLKAKKIGKKDFISKISSGKEGYLPSLENIIENVDIIREEDLGLVDIPLEKIQGTYYHSRALSFANNFYPIFDEKTEFSIKWINLLQIQYEEGIRDPIEVYEYLNWFYVVEGNKRVSVLKYVNAYSIQAKVKRLVPKWDPDDQEIKIYYEFLKFYKKTKINELWFTEEGKFAQMYDIIKTHKTQNSLINDKYKDFITTYFIPFKKTYNIIGGQKLKKSAGDAFLKYIETYGLIIDSDNKIFKNKVKEIIKEIERESGTEGLNIWQLPRILFTGETKIKVAFIYNTGINESAWTYSHEIGRKYVQEKFKNEIETKSFENIDNIKKFKELMEKIEKEDYKLTFSTSFDYLNEHKQSQFQNVKFQHFSGYQTQENINTYFGRMYEPRYLTGIIAGLKTKTNVIGYVAPFGIPEVIMGINAFALGVKSVNPEAKIWIGWTNSWANKEYEKRTTEYLINMKNSDILTHHQDSAEVMKIGEKYGVYTIGYHFDMREFAPKTYLTSVIWKWGKYYSNIIQDIIKGSNFSFFDLFGGSEEIEKFWGGLKSGIVDIAPMSNNIKPQTQNLINIIKEQIKSDDNMIFKGPIYDSKSNLKIPRNVQINDEQLIKMNWFLDNILFE
ncbi:nucleoside-binding protein [Oceanotoga teriensis]|jgi:basic membrane lipoprotein Med (substrate-binding protein (PBP1-ABC) superfamily)|uniref:Nucleoside-binding protein n=1 Tax=Oceanotoga teriensis TaxID=515440 RepID=A0AA45HJ87_9BACT|nr:BMP family ABC transporter substrate-binding protein [Oceanotoga teriensis]PWJ95490.1 nucleoside-binding protein [Oceanotoga teriensis]